ncbi:MAG: hypothetical protein ACREIP_12085 [Alphaproteobacteria bacterium]
MEHKTLEQLERAAETAPIPLTRVERLERWAVALEKLGKTQLNTLLQTEYAAAAALAQLRADSSPLSVASADPVLKVAGLTGDPFGEAMRFFDLAEHELHRIVCYCLYGEKISAEQAAYRVRSFSVAAGQHRGWAW